MSEALAAMEKILLKQRKTNADAENTLYKLKTGVCRKMKCPACGGYAVSNDPEDPFVCSCGWRSDKPNGEAR